MLLYEALEIKRHHVIAYGFAPASTIAPLGTTTLVSNVILAPLMLKEVFRKRDLLGVILAVTGAAIVVFSSNSEEIAVSISDTTTTTSADMNKKIAVT